MAWLRIMCALTFVLATVSSVAARTVTNKTKYVLALFGDSLTDTGNVFRAGGVPDPTIYTDGTYTGRFTDGRNWVDYLQATLKKKHSVQIFNYAWGAATACPDPSLEAAFPYVKNLGNQTLDFARDVLSGKVPKGSDVRLVPIQWIGSNDVLYATRNAVEKGNGLPNITQTAALIRALITCRIAGVQVLAGIPGVRDVVILPLSPLHIAVPPALAPQILQLEGIIAAQTAAAVAAVQTILDALPAGSPGAGVKLNLIGDTNWIARGVELIKPQFKNTTSPCFVNPVASMVLTPGIKICSNPFDHLFYDESHPETRFHQWFALKGLLPRLQQLRILPRKV